MNKNNLIYGLLTAVLTCSSALAQEAPSTPDISTVSSKNAAAFFEKECLQEGYKITNCDEPNKKLADPCPYSAKYYKSCKCAPEFKYTDEECKKMGWQTSYVSCDDKHYCF